MRAITIITIVALPLSAVADETKLTPEQLFELATKEKAQGQTAQACGHFGEALKLSPQAAGMILNVAQCAEDLGQTHTAIVHFTSLKQAAAEQGLHEYEKTADDHLKTLKDVVPHLALSFDDEPLDATTQLAVDGEQYPVTDPDKRVIEVNPGTLHVVVSRPNRVSKEIEVTVKPKETKPLHVKSLAFAVTVNKTRRNIGIVVTSIGVAGVITGGILALAAKHDYDKLFTVDTTTNDYCVRHGNTASCGAMSLPKSQSAITLGNVATVIMVSGAVTAAVGGSVWFFGRKDAKEKRVAIVPLVAPDRAGLFAVGRF
jgi:hypothetical protein